MTEEDTFKKLKQIPLDDITRLFSGWIADKSFIQDSYNTDREEFFKQHGWTWNEWVITINTQREQDFQRMKNQNGIKI
jgi:hypothetical protein